jgi:hypothetical protein
MTTAHVCALCCECGNRGDCLGPANPFQMTKGNTTTTTDRPTIPSTRRRPERCASYSLATLAAIWWAMLTAVFPGLLGHAATSMAMLLLTVNAR